MTVPLAESERLSKERLRLWLRLLKVSRIMESRVRENLRTEFSSTLPRFDVMSALFHYKQGLKMSELSQELKVSNGNITGIVDRLADEGLIQRVAVPGDRRAWMVRLTNEGLEQFQKQAEVHECWVNEMLSNLNGDAARGLIMQLELLAAALQHPPSSKAVS